jgi:hypothetical protein
VAESYGSVRLARAFVPPGRHRLAIRYTFARISRLGRPAVGPYAHLRVLAGHHPLTSAAPPIAARLAGYTVDLVFLAIGLSFLWGWSSAIPKLWPLIPITVVGGTLAVIAPNPFGLPAQSSFTLLYAGLVVWLAIWRPPHALAFGSLALGALAIAQAALTFHGTGTVLYRGGGQDWLTYESQAQHIFATGSLQGGEDVFYWQPGFRYVLVTIRTLLGDGDLLVSALAQTLCNVAVLGLGLSLGRTTPARSLRWIPMALGLVLAVALINAPDILAFISGRAQRVAHLGAPRGRCRRPLGGLGEGFAARRLGLSRRCLPSASERGCRCVPDLLHRRRSGLSPPPANGGGDGGPPHRRVPITRSPQPSVPGGSRSSFRKTRAWSRTRWRFRRPSFPTCSEGSRPRTCSSTS